MSTDKPRSAADFYDGLSPEDILACWNDTLLYGIAYAATDDAGVKRRIPPDEHPHLTEEQKAKQEELARLYDRKEGTPKR